jgi:hypothetical protein
VFVGRTSGTSFYAFPQSWCNTGRSDGCRPGNAGSRSGSPTRGRFARGGWLDLGGLPRVIASDRVWFAFPGCSPGRAEQPSVTCGCEGGAGNCQSPPVATIIWAQFRPQKAGPPMWAIARTRTKADVGQKSADWVNDTAVLKQFCSFKTWQQLRAAAAAVRCRNSRFLQLQPDTKRAGLVRPRPARSVCAVAAGRSVVALSRGFLHVSQLMTFAPVLGWF